jgi:hypothetical protein
MYSSENSGAKVFKGAIDEVERNHATQVRGGGDTGIGGLHLVF